MSQVKYISSLNYEYYDIKKEKLISTIVTICTDN